MTVEEFTKMLHADPSRNAELSSYKILLTKSGNYGLIAFKQFNEFQFVVGEIPEEYKAMLNGSNIPEYFSGVYFCDLFGAMNYFLKVVNKHD